MDEAILEKRAIQIKALSAMGGFQITMEQARRAVLAAEESVRNGTALTLEQAREKVRQLNPQLNR